MELAYSSTALMAIRQRRTMADPEIWLHHMANLRMVHHMGKHLHLHLTDLVILLSRLLTVYSVVLATLGDVAQRMEKTVIFARNQIILNLCVFKNQNQ